MTKKEKTENAIANLDRNARMASVYTEATAARSMLSTNSKIASLAKATSVKHNNSSKRVQVIILQTSGNVSRIRRTTKLTRKMTHSRGIFPPTVLTVQIQSSQNQIERDPGCQYSLAREEDPMYENSTYKRLQDMHEGVDYYTYYHASST
jgi:polynucleotide 5'-kinase involved in rRNA processing